MENKTITKEMIWIWLIPVWLPAFYLTVLIVGLMLIAVVVKMMLIANPELLRSILIYMQ